MSDAFQEVEEELRQERLALFWQRWGNIILSLVAGTVLVTAVISGYRYVDLKGKQAETRVLLQALEADDFPDGFDVSKLELRSGLKALALMRAAGEALQGGDQAAAIGFYGQVIEMPPSDALYFRDLALLMNARLQPDLAENLLKNLSGDSDSIFAGHAALELAAHQAGVLGDFEAAVAGLQALKARADVPASVRHKAEALERVYAGRVVVTKD